MNRLAIFALLLPLAACADDGRAPSAAITSLDRYAGLATGRAATSSPAAFPEAQTSRGAIVRFPAWLGRLRVLERDETGEGWRQRIGFAPVSRDAAEPSDEVTAMVLRSDAPAESDPAKPSEAGIRAELLARFAETEMRVVSRPARNVYGPYGLAVGRRADGAGCLYAWQWIDGAPAARLGAGAVSLRVSLCRTRENLDALAGAMDHLRLDLDAVAPPPEVASRHASPRRVRTVQVRDVAPSASPQPSNIAAPGPSDNGRIYLASPPAETASRAGPLDARVAGATLASRAGPATAARTGDVDLPPEALRGPARAGDQRSPATPALPASR